MAMPVLPILLLPLTMAVSDTLPNFSTEPTCRGGLTDPRPPTKRDPGAQRGARFRFWGDSLNET